MKIIKPFATILTNISNGGLGIWAGYGTSYHRVTVGNQ